MSNGNNLKSTSLVRFAQRDQVRPASPAMILPLLSPVRAFMNALQKTFSILLEELAYGSFSGLIVIPLASTWSRARNSGVRGPPPLRSRQSPLGMQGLPSKLLDQVREHTEALELCFMALDVWCRSFPSRPFFFVAPQDRRGQQQHRPASIWQLAAVMAIVQRTREATRSSAFACELRAADSPRPLAFISNLCYLSSGLVRGWPRLHLKGDFLQYSGPLSRNCACGKPQRELRGIAHRGQFPTQVAPLFPVQFWSSVLEATGKTSGMEFQFRRKVIERVSRRSEGNL